MARHGELYRVDCTLYQSSFPLIRGLQPTRHLWNTAEANTVFEEYKRWLENNGYKRIRSSQRDKSKGYVSLEQAIREWRGDTLYTYKKQYYYEKI